VIKHSRPISYSALLHCLCCNYTGDGFGL